MTDNDRPNRETDVLPPGVRGSSPVSRMEGDTPEATAWLAAMCEQAREYRESFSWRERIIQEYFGEELAGIVAAFLFKIEPKSTDVQH